MITFWISAAVVAAVTIGLLLRPLFARHGEGVTRTQLNLSVYRDQLRELEADLRAGTLAREDYDRARRELEKRLLEEVEDKPAPAQPAAKPRRLRAFSVGAGIAIPLLAAGIYLATGNPAALDPAKRHEQAGAKEIEAMVQRLADRLAQNPDDVEGWKLLGKSYAVMGRFPEAANAYAKAAAKTPRDPQLLADLADALAMARGQKMAGEPEELAQRALQLDPQNPKALALAGTAAYERADYPAAIGYWERMLPLVAEGSEDKRIIESNIEEARKLSGAPLAKSDAAQKKPAGKKAAAVAALQGSVTLSPGLAGKVKPDDTLFVFARAADGPPMPLAILRSRAGELPLKFSLDDSSSMTAQKLSDVGRVIVVARVSKSGNAVPQAGDLQGASAPVANNARGVHVVIDTEVAAK